jgi:hypothetical protein
MFFLFANLGNDIKAYIRSFIGSFMKNVLQCQVRHLFQAAYRGASAKMLASAESGDLNPLFEILTGLFSRRLHNFHYQ